ncbi:MAG: hypothetical protein MI754_03490 [Chromatiales bacterium]|nr:hypothetical protein [Chromatiales bacterium]
MTTLRQSLPYLLIFFWWRPGLLFLLMSTCTLVCYGKHLQTRYNHDPQRELWKIYLRAC